MTPSYDHVFASPSDVFRFLESDPLPHFCKIQRKAGDETALKIVRGLRQHHVWFLWLTPTTRRNAYLKAIEDQKLESHFSEFIYSYEEALAVLREKQIQPSEYGVIVLENPPSPGALPPILKRLHEANPSVGFLEVIESPTA